MDEPRLFLFWHVATINNWQDIVAEQAGKMLLSGLLPNLCAAYVGVVGPVRPKLPGQFSVMYYSEDRLEYEIPTIRMMDEIVRGKTCRPQDKVLYLHSKGAGREDLESQVNVSFWRRYMEEFVVWRWRDCVLALDGCDACGVDMNWNPWPHFAGNFWWAKAGFLRTLPDPITLSPSDPVRCELRIGESSREMSLHELHNSGRNLYLEKYLARDYRDVPTKMPQVV